MHLAFFRKDVQKDVQRKRGKVYLSFQKHHVLSQCFESQCLHSTNDFCPTSHFPTKTNMPPLFGPYTKENEHIHIPSSNSFCIDFFFTKKNEQETKRSATLPTLKTKREPKKITFTSLPRVWPNNKGKKRPCFRHHFPGKPSPTIGRSWPPRPPQKRLFLAPAIEATLRSRQALQPLQAKSVPTLRCDHLSWMVVGCGCGLGLGKVFWKLSFFW